VRGRGGRYALLVESARTDARECVGPAEGLFDAIAGVVATVVNPQTVVAGFDSQTDCVIFTFDIGSGVRTRAGYDVRRQLWVGPNNDFGLALRGHGMR
jgi:hypothetical protein